MADEPQIDAELVELLGSAVSKPQQLDAAPPFTREKPKPKSKTTPPAAPAPAEAFEAELEDEVPEPQEETDIEPPKRDLPPIVEPELKPANENIKLPANVEMSPLLPPKKVDGGELDVVSLQVQELLIAYGDHFKTTVKNYDKDRVQIEQVISLLDTVVRTSILQKGASPYVDALARLLATKAEINTNATSALDSIAKLLAAAKSNDVIVNLGGVQKGQLDLEALLSQPKREDER